MNRNLVLRILGKRGYDADVAEDGAMPEERARCFSSGMQGFLSRPLAPADLRRVLGDWAPLGGVAGSSGQRVAPADPKAVAI